MKKNYLLLAAMAVLLFTGCDNGLRNNELSEIGSSNNQEENIQQTGTVTINLNTASRTITPVSGWNIDDIEDWTISFYDNDTKVTPTSSDTNTYILPIGEYKVTAEGKLNKNTENYTVYGFNTVEIKNKETTSVNINVSLKKTGTGNFNYDLSFSNTANDILYAANDDVAFKAYLIPSDSSNQINLNCEEIIESETSADGTTTATDCITGLTITGNDITSGYYYLHISYYWENYENYEYEYSLGDNLIEIIDDKTTSGKKTVSASLAWPVIYVTYAESSYTGLTSDYPANIYEAMNILSTQTNVENVYFNVIGTAPITKDGEEDWCGFQLDLSKNIATGKTIHFSKNFNDVWLLPDGTIKGDFANATDLYLTYTDNTSSNSKTAKLDLSFAENEYLPQIFHSDSDIGLEIVKLPPANYLNKIKANLIISGSEYDYSTAIWNVKYPATCKDDSGSEFSVSTTSLFEISQDYSSSERNSYLYSETKDISDDTLTTAVYIQPDMTSESNKTNFNISATYDGNEVTSGTYFDHTSTEKDVVNLKTTKTGNIRWFIISEDNVNKILSTTSTLDINLSDYTSNTIIYCYSSSNNSYTYNLFTLKVLIEGLFIDSTNDYFLYLDGEALTKGRGLWMGDDQNQAAYLKVVCQTEYENLSSEQMKIYNTLPSKAVFAYDYYDKYSIVDNVLMDADGNSLYTYDSTSKTFYTDSLKLSLYDDTKMNYISSYNGINYGIPYFIVDGSTTPDTVTSGCSVADLSAAVSNADSDKGEIIFIGEDITVASGTEGTGADSKSYVQLTNTTYISGKKYDGTDDTYKIDTSNANIRVFDTELAYGCKLYTSNIQLIGGDLTADKFNGGVVYLTGKNNCSYNFYGGTIIKGGSAVNGGGIYFYSTSVSNYVCFQGNVQITDNSASSNGGGIYSYCGNATTYLYSGTVISGNKADKGAGIYNDYGTLNLQGGTISGNSAASGGDGIYISSSCSGPYGNVSSITDDIMYAIYSSSISKLSSFPENTASKPYVISISDSNPTLSSIASVLNANSNIYVTLDLSKATNLTGVDANTFENCTTLVGITLPSSVKSIGDSAFSSCTNLADITIPSSVTSIGASSFQKCENLITVTFVSETPPETIGDNAFSGCSRLSYVYIPTNTCYEDYYKALSGQISYCTYKTLDNTDLPSF